MFPDPASEWDMHEDEARQYEQTLPIALLPARCPKFQVGSQVMHMHSETGDLHRIADARFETAYPAQWWYRLDGSRRWYPEGHLWTGDDWHEYMVQRSVFKMRSEQQAQDRLNPPDPPRWRDFVTALTNPEYVFQVRKYRQAFVDHIHHYYGAWKPPVELYHEYMSCVGFVRE
jgi:hypothetical protein